MTFQPDNGRAGLPVIIRPAQIEDAGNLKALCWPDRSDEMVIELLRRAQKLALNRRGLGVVAAYQETACAFGLLTLWPRAAEISDLIVHSAYRGQGIGSLIIASLTEAACSLKVQTLEIGVALSNPRALALYRRLGFKDAWQIELELGHGLESVLYLAKTLP